MRFNFLALLIVIIILSGILFDYFGFIFDLFRNHHNFLSSVVEEWFLISILVFTLGYFLSTAFSLPIGTVLSLIGGYLFDVFYGFISVIIGATLGALILFIIIRRGSMEKFKDKYKGEILLRIQSGIKKDLWSYLFFIRFFPIFPFWFVNIAPALLGVRLVPYIITTFFGIMPGTLFIVILGSGIGDIISEDMIVDKSFLQHDGFLLGLCFLSFLVIFPVIYKKFRTK